jgi:hypothetical protein
MMHPFACQCYLHSLVYLAKVVAASRRQCWQYITTDGVVQSFTRCTTCGGQHSGGEILHTIINVQNVWYLDGVGALRTWYLSCAASSGIHTVRT